MEKTADEIRHRMSRVRNEIDEDVVELVESAKSLVDWKDYVRSYPLLSAGLACAAGAVLVPSKKPEKITADAAAVAGLLKNKDLVVAPNAKVKEKNSIGGTLIATVAATLVRAAVGYAGQKASAAMSQQQGRKI